MRIWFTASVASARHNSMHRSMNMLAAELRSYGHTVKLYLMSPGRRKSRKLFIPAMLYRYLFLFWRRPHWIITHPSDGLLFAIISRQLFKRTRVALFGPGRVERIIDLEHRLPASLVAAPTVWHLRLIKKALLRLSIRESALCICSTVDEARWLQGRYRAARGKTIVIPTGVRQVRHPYWPLQQDFPPSFLMTGRFTWKMNLEYGIELFRRLLSVNNTARLFIVGCGPLSEQKKRLLFPLGDAVFTVENESPEKMYRWYESCPFMLVPSRYEESRPEIILEAQLRGCIVFASDIPPVRECITPGVNGFIISGVNPVADAALLTDVIGSRETILRIGNAAAGKASRQSVKRQGKRLLRALSATVNTS